MELYIAIEKMVKNSGEIILLEGRLINMLMDQNAFEQYPAAKNILREIIAGGYSQQLIKCSAWTPQIEKIVTHFVDNSGFQKPLSYYTFQCIAYSLGWLSKVDKPISERQEIKDPEVKPFYSLSQAEKRAYIRSIINIDIDFSSYGVTALWFLDTGKGYLGYTENIRVVLTIEGFLTKDLPIQFITYDKEGKEVNNYCLVLFKKRYCSGVMEYDGECMLGKSIIRISKIEFSDKIK